MVGKAAGRVYGSLATYALANGLDPHAFGMDYARVADLARYADKTSAYDGAVKAEACGLLCRLDRGTARRGGAPTLFCLRGKDESLADAIEAGKQTKAYLERLRENAADDGFRKRLQSKQHHAAETGHTDDASCPVSIRGENTGYGFTCAPPVT